MILEFAALIKQYKINPRGIIQLGTHFFQERDEFIKLGIKEFVLVEPQKHAFRKLKSECKGLNVLAFNCAVSNFEGKFEMKCDILNEGQSSSLLEADEHKKIYPQIEFSRIEIVDVQMLKNLEFDRKKYNILYIDLQGGELNALNGSGTLLNYIDAIYTEVNLVSMYKNCVLLPQLDGYLHKHGFNRVSFGENIKNKWGEAFYIKI